MKIISITIHNFRGIIEQSITFENYSLLVGANNSGKSTVIDAIQAFYEKDGFKYKEGNDFPFADNTDIESWIELQFSLSEAENDSLADEYKTATKLLKVRKYFKTTSRLSDGKPATGYIFGYKTDGTLSNDPFYGAKNVQSGKFGDIIYIPAISKVDDITKLTGPSALRDLITNIMAEVVENSESYKNLTESIEAFSNSIRTTETVDKRSLAGFENDLNKMLATWNTQFTLRFNCPSTAELIKNMLGYDFQDNYFNKTQDIDYFGSGFQRHFIYSLIQLGAQYIPNKITKKLKDFCPSFNLILFEEPEAFLHPPQQEELSRNLISISETPNWQVISSTHSSHFVSRNAGMIPSIIRLNRNQGIIQAFQIKSDDWDNLVDVNQANAIAAKYPMLSKKIQSDDLQPIMEAIKYFLWLNPDRASMFFANAVLLVEGPSEKALIHRLHDESKLKLPNGTFILDCIGKYNIHRFMNLLKFLGVPHSVLCDDDNNVDEHIDLNQLIMDSRNEYTIEVKFIDDKLEALLAIPSASRPDRKPQHILFYYSTGKIKNNLHTFCTLVESCFPTEGP
jgi:putative ATP-dependent endonuclease of OLD family